MRTSIREAWDESDPGIFGGHEEGGFVLKDQDSGFHVIRWPRGGRNEIVVPPHANGFVDGVEIIASFHTHPNSGSRFLQEPSETDLRSVRDDPDLVGDAYLGEFVISRSVIYLVLKNAEILELGSTDALLFVTEE